MEPVYQVRRTLEPLTTSCEVQRTVNDVTVTEITQ